MLTLVLAGSRLIFSTDEPEGDVMGVVNPAPINNGSLNWANLDFSGLPYASNGDGQFDRFVNCASGGCVPTFDLRGAWLTQDASFMAWKITGKNFSNATFCGRSANLSLEIEFDADGSVSTGCRSGTDTCYPGADYKIIINASGNGSINIFNSASGPACSGNACFNLSNNVSIFVNISKNVNGTCDSDPSVVKVAVNKSHMKWSVLTFNVVTKSEGAGPIDLLGANRQDFGAFGFGGGKFMEEAGNASFMFKQDGCGSFNNESYCTNGVLNGNFSCVWESDFNHCRPNFDDSGSYGCSDFCGA
ncbi:hypothetical protein HYU15_03215, partial [Candidatus Woesearchaeota archaeon]|nr:hypothetical protein [Candidatus Woesearchaeota archaeon]